MPFPTPDAALRWALRQEPLRSADPARVSIGRTAGRASFEVSNDARSRIVATPQHLREKERAALLLRAQGHSFSELAQKLGCSARTAARMVARGREIVGGRLRTIGLLEREESAAR